MLNLLFAGMALVEVFVLSQLHWWGGSIGLLLLLLLIFRRGTTTNELLFASTVYVFMATIFVSNEQLIVALLSSMVAVSVLLIFVGLTDALARTRVATFIQGSVALALGLLVQSLIEYVSLYGKVQLFSMIGVFCVTLMINGILLGVTTIFLRVKPGDR